MNNNNVSLYWSPEGHCLFLCPNISCDSWWDIQWCFHRGAFTGKLLLTERYLGAKVNCEIIKTFLELDGGTLREKRSHFHCSCYMNCNYLLQIQLQVCICGSKLNKTQNTSLIGSEELGYKLYYYKHTLIQKLNRYTCHYFIKIDTIAVDAAIEAVKTSMTYRQRQIAPVLVMSCLPIIVNNCQATC